MNNLFFVLGFISTLAAPLNNYSQPVQPVFQVDEKPKKEILVSINSTYYKNPSQVVEGVFKQARIYDFTIDEKVKESKNKNITKLILLISYFCIDSFCFDLFGFDLN
jgi:hypothetical protein